LATVNRMAESSSASRLWRASGTKIMSPVRPSYDSSPLDSLTRPRKTCKVASPGLLCSANFAPLRPSNSARRHPVPDRSERSERQERQRIGWANGITILRDRMRELRALSVRIRRPGRCMCLASGCRCDLCFPPTEVPVGSVRWRRPPVWVMAAGYSRMIFAVKLPSQQAPDLFTAHWWLLSQRIRAVPRELLWDNKAAVGRGARGRPRLTDKFEAFRGVLESGCIRTGKTHLATEIAIRACRAGHRVLFAIASQMGRPTRRGHHNGRPKDALNRLARYPLLVIDGGATSRSSTGVPRPTSSSYWLPARAATARKRLPDVSRCSWLINWCPSSSVEITSASR